MVQSFFHSVWLWGERIELFRPKSRHVVAGQVMCTFCQANGWRNSYLYYVSILYTLGDNLTALPFSGKQIPLSAKFMLPVVEQSISMLVWVNPVVSFPWILYDLKINGRIEISTYDFI